MFDLRKRVALFGDIEPHWADPADHRQTDAIDRERFQQNAKPAGMVLLVRDHTDNVRYAERLKEGQSSGSGQIEGACKTSSVAA